ncbi:MoaF N-terminal domain-containing protein [uncultured Pluralibacter sp.]|uniref:MoaF-related domain-containing protein n=1 Tax=uncultured Pluralibacter sp. TaxID=1490864 RepID=UPI00261AA4D2|nr:MoaF N-terminal domain-containing protein [uncultured Pluralibacter sp.]
MKMFKHSKIVLSAVVSGALFISAGAWAQSDTANSSPNAAQHQQRPFIGAGKVVQVTFGDRAFNLDFTSDTSMTFTTVGSDATDTVQYTAVEIRPKVYMVYWHEPGNGDNVTHIQDYERGIVYTNIASVDDSFTHLKGTLKIIGPSGGE